MITLNANINLISGDNSNLTAVSSNVSPSEFSSDIGAILGVEKTAIEGTPTSKVDYFIGNELSDSFGRFAKPFELTLKSTIELGSLTLAFDTTNNSFPKAIYFMLPAYTKKERLSFRANVGIIEERTYDREIESVYVVEDIGTVSLTADRKGWRYSCGAQVGDTALIIATISVAFKAVSEKRVVDDDAIYTIVNLPKPNDNTYTISINEWNKPNSPVVITGIYIPITISLNARNLTSISNTVYQKSDTKLPSYGVYSNSGEVEFIDANGEIADYADLLLLNNNLKVNINLVNTLTGRQEQVASVLTEEWSYDNYNKVARVSLKDDLEEWQDIHIQGFSYDPRNAKSVLPNQTMADLYKWLHKKTPSKYNMLVFDKLDETTKSVLNGTFIPYPHLNSGSLWEQWVKVCQVCALYIYKSKGNTICTYLYGG